MLKVQGADVTVGLWLSTCFRKELDSSILDKKKISVIPYSEKQNLEGVQFLIRIRI